MFSFFRRKSHAEKFAAQVAQEYMDAAEERADSAMEQVRSGLFKAAILEPETSDYFVKRLGGADFLFSFELQFLWGLYREHVKTRSMPTDEHSRIKLHLIARLVKRHGMTIGDAKTYMFATEKLFNAADPLFDAIADLGAEAYHGKSDDALVRVIRASRRTNEHTSSI